MNKVTKFKGNTNKDGVIAKCKSGFMFYNGMNDDGLKTIFKTGKKSKSRVKTVKVFEPVTIANNQVTVTVYPNGKIEVVTNDI
jgi:hypothetical protein